LQTFLTLLSDIPSHDTFNRVFAALDPAGMGRGFAAWVLSITKLTAGEVVAIGFIFPGSMMPVDESNRVPQLAGRYC